MTKSELRRAFDTANTQPVINTGGDQQLESLFRMYRAADAALECYGRAGHSAADSACYDRVIDTQSAIMRRAVAVKASSIKGVLYKLAMWRRDAPDLNVPLDELMRYDAIAVSAFRDLASLLGEEDILIQDDITHCVKV